MRGMRVGKSCTAIEREERTREWGGWRWRFGKRTVEKSLDSYERENRAESRQTDRRWLRLTGYAATLPSPALLLTPSILLCRHRAIRWLPLSQPVVLPQQYCHSFQMTCRHAPKHTLTFWTGVNLPPVWCREWRSADRMVQLWGESSLWVKETFIWSTEERVMIQ